MTVEQLIAFLQTQPKDLVIAYGLYSEQCLMELDDIRQEERGVARPDGWVQNERPDMPSQMYLLFPGN